MGVIHTTEYYSDKKATKCPICGKMFIPAPEHARQIGNWGNEVRYVNVCTYTCMRKWEKEQTEMDRAGNQVVLDAILPKIADQTMREIAGLYMVGEYKPWKIGEIVGLSVEEVRRYISDIETLVCSLEDLEE